MARACIRLPGVQRLRCIRVTAVCRLPYRARPSPADEVDDAGRRRRRRRRRSSMGPMHAGRDVGLQLAGTRGTVGRRTRPLPGRLDDPQGTRRRRHVGAREVGVDRTGITPAGLPARRHRAARRSVLASRRWSGIRLVVELHHGREGHHRPRGRRHHHRPRRITRRLPRIPSGTSRRAVPHDARPFPTRGRPLLPEHSGRERFGRRQIPRGVPRAVRRRAGRLQRRDRPALQVRRSRWLGGDLHLRVRHHASVGGLRRVLRALSAYRRHHRHQPRGGPCVEGRPGALFGAEGHRPVGVLCRCANRAVALRLAMDVAVLQPGQHRNGHAIPSTRSKYPRPWSPSSGSFTG